MRLLVDEDSQAKLLVQLLVAAGHDVLTADAAGLNSMADGEVSELRGCRRKILPHFVGEVAKPEGVS